MFLIVGLGNPGQEYQYTRHNIGFVCLDELASRHNLDWQLKKNFNALVTPVLKDQGESVVLCKPQTYMNLSGESVLALSSFYKIPPANIIVIHDEIDLALGVLRCKFSGGSAGHNGLKSIASKIGQDFHRIRFGVGRPEHRDHDIAKFVLERFASSEEEVLQDRVKFVADNISLFWQGRADDLKKSCTLLKA